MMRRALLATLLVVTPVLYAKERILLHRIGPSQSTLFIANADGSNERALLPNSGFDYNASLSADGKWIVFTSERGGSADIYRVHPDGSGLERLTDDPAYDDQGALSPDGKQLAFVSSRGTGSADIWVLDLQTKKAQNLSHAPGSFRPSWSPDGKWIAFSSDRNTPVRRDGGRFEQSHAVSIYLMRADGTDVRRLTAAGKFAGSPKWSPDGERIVFYEMDIQDTFYARRASPVVGPGKLVDSQIVSETILSLAPEAIHDPLAIWRPAREPAVSRSLGELMEFRAIRAHQHDASWSAAARSKIETYPKSDPVILRRPLWRKGQSALFSTKDLFSICSIRIHYRY